MARRFWSAVHRYCGLFTLGLLFVIALTGSMIAFEHEIDAWLNPKLLQVDHRQRPLRSDKLIELVEKAHPQLRISQFPLDAKPGESYELRVAPRTDPRTGRPYPLSFDRLFIDPATGIPLGARQWGAPRLDRVHLMPFLDVLHRKLHLPGPWGMWLTGSVALLWVISSLAGVYLTLPRASSRRGIFFRRWMPAWQIKRGSSWKRTNYDTHRAVALWSLPVTMALAVSGIYFSLGNEVFRPIVRLFGPITPHPMQTLPRLASTEHSPEFTTEEAVRRARSHLPEVTRSFLPWYASHLPQFGVYRIAFKEDGMREQRLRVRYEQVFIDDRTGELKGLSGYDSGTGADRFLVWQYPLHTGRVLGWWGR